MKKNILSEEIVRNLEIMFPNKIQFERVFNKINSTLINEAASPLTNILKRTALELLEKAALVAEKRTKAGKIVKTIEGLGDVEKSEIDDISAALQRGDDELSSISGPARGLITRIIRNSANLEQQIYEGAILPAAERAGLGEKEFISAISNNAIAESKTVRQYLLDTFGGNELIADVLLSKVQKGIDDIENNKFVESLGWYRIVEKEQNSIIQTYKKYEPDFLRWARQTFIVTLNENGMIAQGEILQSQKQLRARINKKLAHIKSMIGKSKPEEINAELESLIMTCANYSKWSGESLVPMFEQYLEKNKIFKPEDIKLITNKGWYKAIMRDQLRPTRIVMGEAFFDSLFSYLKAVLPINPLGLIEMAIKGVSFTKQNLVKYCIIDLRRTVNLIIFRNPRLVEDIISTHTKAGRWSSIVGFFATYLVFDYWALPYANAAIKLAITNNAEINQLNDQIELYKKKCSELGLECADLKLLENPNEQTYNELVESQRPFFEFYDEMKSRGIIGKLTYPIEQFTHIDGVVDFVLTVVGKPLLFGDIRKLNEFNQRLKDSRDKLAKQMKDAGFNPDEYKDVEDLLNGYEEFLKTPEAHGISNEIILQNPCITDSKNKDALTIEKIDDATNKFKEISTGEILYLKDNIFYHEDTHNPGKPNIFRKFCSSDATETILPDKITVDEIKNIASCYWDGVDFEGAGKIIVDKTQGTNGIVISNNDEFKIYLKLVDSSGNSSQSDNFTIIYSEGDKKWKFKNGSGNFECIR